MIRIAILDEYQNASLEMADWSPLAGRAAITVFNDHLSNFDKVVERLLPFFIVGGSLLPAIILLIVTGVIAWVRRKRTMNLLAEVR